MADPNRASNFAKASAASFGLSALFLVVYGWCNWFTAHRADVPTLFFKWERLIPFVPVMIIPYMSIDLFFVGAPFLCRTRRELAMVSKQIVTAILVAGVCFLLFPLRFGFERPPAAGWLGEVFDWFRGLDQPYNLLPSLHIAFLTILADLYARHTRGLLQQASRVWFILIGLSALLTYQHHVTDVVAGFALGAYCLYLFHESSWCERGMPNRRVGSYYLTGVFVVTALAIWFWPWGALLAWFIISLGLAALAYFGWGPGIYRKRNGRLPWTTWWALGPVLLGQEMSRRYYRRRSAAWDELTPAVWVGGVLSENEADEAAGRGVRAVLDLTAEFSEPSALRALSYKNIPVLDLTAPTLAQLEEMAAFVDEESRKGIVYVHCKIGYSRTAAVAAAYLLRTGMVKTVTEAVAWLRKIRPGIVIRPEILGILNEFARTTRLPVVANSLEPSSHILET